MLSEGGRNSEEEKSNHSARAEHPQSKGHETLGSFWVSVCAVQLTQLGPTYNSEQIVFFFPWLAGCFTFRSLNKQEIKRTSNKTTNRAPHTTLLSWEAQCESL